ncbi:phosphotransferase family protein [Rhizorhabdus argentea]|uniref:phosphotransferase family protein n=1 Tax=Rhizorhabdus argentea TaxID=1387174 RepID=UPI0030EC330D
MDSGKRRLLSAIADSMERVASRYGVPASDMDHVALTTAIAELLRREEADPIKAFYSAGYALALRLADMIQQRGVAEADIATLHRLPPSIEDSADFSLSQDLLVALKEVLSSLVSNSGYPSDPNAGLESIISSLCRWEGDHHTVPSSPPPTAKAKDRHDVKQMLESSARAQGGELEGAHVTEFTSLIGGFTNETTLFKLAGKDGGIWDLVARANTGLQLGIDGRDIAGEFHLLRYLYEAGVSVAEPMWLEPDVERYGTQFLVTRKVEGGNFGTVVEAQRLNSSQMQALATQLAKIHRLSLDETHPDLQRSHIDMGLAGGSMTEGVSNYLERWIRLWRSTGLENSPTVEATLNWLRANIPRVEEPPALVHGDYGLHNIMMQGDEISGVLDWEMSHFGNPAEDISGLLASFPNEDDAKEFMRFYIEAGGRPITDFEREYCNVFRYFMLYVVTLESQLRFYSIPELHPEFLVLGSFVQTPAQRMAQAIEDAEKIKARE